MGTRNITIVKVGGKTKVAQYGQWDGYPTGQGQTIADFLKKVDLEKFKAQVKKLGVYSSADLAKAWKDAGANPKDEWVSSDISDKKNKAHPELCRDHGAGILQLIYDGVVAKVDLFSGYDTKTGGLVGDSWIEYWYEIDLDKEIIKMNNNKTFTFKEWTKKDKMKALEKVEEKENE